MGKFINNVSNLEMLVIEKEKKSLVDEDCPNIFYSNSFKSFVQEVGDPVYIIPFPEEA